MRHETVKKLLTEASKDPTIKTIGELKDRAREIQRERFGTLSENENFVHKVDSLEAVGRAGDHMAEFGNYPHGMSVCEIVGLNGGCGDSCPQLQDGGCQVFDYEKDEFK